jgi:hypothetical protein
MRSSGCSVRQRSAGAFVAGVLCASILHACGGAPNAPGWTPTPPVTSPGVATGSNEPPVIEAINLGSDHTEIDGEVAVTAVVRDSETPIDLLQFEWKAEAGTFSGDGASVKWRAPHDIATPADYILTLTVIETYGAPDAAGVRPQNVTTASSQSIRVHNSPKELGDLSIRFLSDFANSSIPAATCVRDFTDSCRGKAEELGDIEANRINFEIISSSLNLRSVSVDSNGLAANMTVACSFTSKIKQCPSGETTCVVGSIGTARGDCLLTGRYEQKRWWLCDSHFLGQLGGAMRAFFGRM